MLYVNCTLQSGTGSASLIIYIGDGGDVSGQFILLDCRVMEELRANGWWRLGQYLDTYRPGFHFIGSELQFSST